LGIGNRDNQSIPVQESSYGVDWHEVTVNQFGGLGVRIDGTAWGWGANSQGSYTLTPQRQDNNVDWEKLCVKGQYDRDFIGLKKDGTLWAKGYNLYGSLGLNSDIVWVSSPTQIGTENTWASISAKGTSCAGIKKDGTLWTWGFNRNGECGTGDFEDKSSPVQTTLGGSNWAKVSVDHAEFTGAKLALKKDGTLWELGAQYIDSGYNVIKNSTPQQVAGVWTDCAANGADKAALKSDGSIWVWGANSSKIGTGSLIAPTKVNTNIPFVKVEIHGCIIGLTATNSVCTFGWNDFGQCGIGSSAATVLLPTLVSTLANQVVKIPHDVGSFLMFLITQKPFVPSPPYAPVPTPATPVPTPVYPDLYVIYTTNE
jgi:alpha-tubulin suppressor-like RCC1 family protein